MTPILDLFKMRSQKQYNSSEIRTSYSPTFGHTDPRMSCPQNPAFTDAFTNVRKSHSPNSAYTTVRTSHSPTPLYTKVHNHNHTGIVFSEYREELNDLWLLSLLQYKSSMNEITAKARIQLASTVDAKTSKIAVDAVVAELKKTSSKNLDQYMHGIFKLIEGLPAEKADPIVDYWKHTSDYYGGVIGAFDKAFFTTMGVMLEANAKTIMQCDRLDKETSAIYDKLFT